jgi:hypothetical protein
MALIAPLIGAVGGLLGGVLGGRQQRKNVRRQLAADKELAAFAHSQDIDMWNRQNQYNRPIEQMKRLEEAGLNPNLVYGSGSAAGNTAGQMPKYQQVRSDYSKVQPYFDPMSIIGAYQNIEQQNAQIDNVKLQNQRQAIENSYLDSIMWSKDFGSRASAFAKSLQYETMAIDPRDVPKGKEWILRTPSWARYQSELKRSQASAKSIIVGEQIKQIEKEFMENMKQMGLTKGYGGLMLQLLRMAIGK